MTKNFVIAGNRHQYAKFIQGKMVNPKDYTYVSSTESLMKVAMEGVTIFLVGEFWRSKEGILLEVERLVQRGARRVYATV